MPSLAVTRSRSAAAEHADADLAPRVKAEDEATANLANAGDAATGFYHLASRRTGYRLRESEFDTSDNFVY